MDINKENIVQAVIIADSFNNNFHPITTNKSMTLLPLVGMPIVNFILESLAQGGVDETILFCCQNATNIKEYINECVKNKAPWSITMVVQVMMSDTCQTMGDVMREIDAAGLIRGHFILTGVNTVANIPFASLLEQHKQTCKKDKGAVMTLVYKKVSWDHKLINSDRPIFLAANGYTNKVLIHHKYKPKSNVKSLSLPLEIVLSNSEIKLHHNLADTNIALCSPAVPPLFSDNFDFQTRDDFIHGILINEEILNSSLYYLPLKTHYAACATNWMTYQTISRDVLHHWAHPLSIETGSLNKNNYTFMENHNYIHKNATLSRYCTLGESVLIGDSTHVNDLSKVTKSVIGSNCKIGKNVTIESSYIQNGVVIEDNCKVVNSFVDDGTVIGENSTFDQGTIVVSNITIDKNSELSGKIIQNSDLEKNVIGSNCKIGKNVTIESSYIQNGVVIEDNCKVVNSFVDDGTVIGENSTLDQGTIVVSNITIDKNSELSGKIIQNSDLEKNVIGSNCKIGKNVTIESSYIQNGVVIEDNCKVVNSFVDDGTVIGENSTLDQGTIVVSNITIDKNSELSGKIIQNSDLEKNAPETVADPRVPSGRQSLPHLANDFFEAIPNEWPALLRYIDGKFIRRDKSLSKSTSETTEWENESGSGDNIEEYIGLDKNWSASASYCSSDSSDDDISLPESPEPDDTNIFLQEVIDSLARGYEEKLKCDYLILEINSSRYAYNIQLHEVNFYVVRALLSMPVLTGNINALKDILKYFNPVLTNYIKTKSSILDCLKAVEDCCVKCEWLEGRAGHIVNLLYGADIIDEDSLTEWYAELKGNESPIANQASLIKFFEWLEEASEESENSE